jgi:hypothetical protein
VDWRLFLPIHHFGFSQAYYCKSEITETNAHPSNLMKLKLKVSLAVSAALVVFSLTPNASAVTLSLYLSDDPADFAVYDPTGIPGDGWIHFNANVYIAQFSATYPAGTVLEFDLYYGAGAGGITGAFSNAFQYITITNFIATGGGAEPMNAFFAFVMPAAPMPNTITATILDGFFTDEDSSGNFPTAHLIASSGVDYGGANSQVRYDTIATPPAPGGMTLFSGADTFAPPSNWYSDPGVVFGMSLSFSMDASDRLELPTSLHSLAMPIPEPSSSALVLGGSLLALKRRRRRNDRLSPD